MKKSLSVERRTSNLLFFSESLIAFKKSVKYLDRILINIHRISFIFEISTYICCQIFIIILFLLEASSKRQVSPFETECQETYNWDAIADIVKVWKSHQTREYWYMGSMQHKSDVVKKRQATCSATGT